MPGKTLYCLGEAWLELNSTAPLASAETFSPRMGGSAASLALAYAAQGGRASLLTQLGEDAFGHRIADALSTAGVDVSRVCFTSRAPTPLLFDGGGEQLGCRTRSSELLYAPEQLGADWAADAEMLAFSSACLVDSPCRYTHLAALDTARTAGVPVCFVPSLRPALWPGEKTLRDTVMQFLPFADILVLTADEMELLLDIREYQVGLFALLRGHTQLVVLETEEGVHAFTRAAHAFWPGLSAPPEELAARLRRLGLACAIHVDRANVMTHGTPADVTRAVHAAAKAFDVMNGGAYFYVETDNGFPLENIRALLEAIGAYRKEA